MRRCTVEAVRVSCQTAWNPNTLVGGNGVEIEAEKEWRWWEH